MQRIISGIQQVGIGVSNACEAFSWYKTHFGFDTIVFEDRAQATLMSRYTGNTVHERYAVLAMNMQGGGGFEIWQYTSRQPNGPLSQPQLGDTGAFAIKLRCKDVSQAYTKFNHQGLKLLSSLYQNPVGNLHFYMSDPYGNVFEIIEDNYWFGQKKHLTGGVCGALIGVSDMEIAIPFYQHVLGYTSIVCDEEKVFTDFSSFNGGQAVFRRVLLKHDRVFNGPFSKLLGPTTIELVQAKERVPQKIYAGRYWGDLGFVHICYDVCGMKEHATICERQRQPLTVDSENSFSMGKAAGHFAYNEDPDGTLIEYVETHQVPILKKLGWYLDLRKRNQTKPLPNWMVRCMGLGKKGLQLSS